jgi:DNA-binding beta-propeller fold protein YncE
MMPYLDRRDFLAQAGLGAGLGALALAAGIEPARAAPATPLAIVMNSGSASLSVIDMASRKVVRTEPMLREPSHWALTPDRTRLLVCDASGNALFTLDPATGEARGHQAMADPYQIGFSPDGRFFIANALRLNFVEIFDGHSLRSLARLKVGGMPSHLDYSPDSRWSFNSMQETGTLVSLDLATLKPRWTTKVGSTPAGVLWHRDKVLCCAMGTHDVAVVDPVSGKVERRVETGVGPHNLFLSPDKGTLYVSNRVGGSLAALDAETLKVRRVYPMHATGPDDLAIAPDGKLWIALRFHEAVAVLDPASGEYETIPVGRSPHGIYLTTMLSNPGQVTAERL